LRYYGANATSNLTGLPPSLQQKGETDATAHKDPYARPAIQTLERLHAELGGKILENKQEHENLAGQMRHVEAVIKMLDPGYSLRAISVKRRGTVYRRAVDALRTATEPLTAREIAERLLVAANVNDPNKARWQT
jgi:hypothetical protein